MILSIIIYLFTYFFIAFVCAPIWPEPNLFGMIIICIFIIVASLIHACFWQKILFPSNYYLEEWLEGRMGWWLEKQIKTYKWRQQKKEELRKAIIRNEEYDHKQRELAQQKTVRVKQYYRRKPKRK